MTSKQMTPLPGAPGYQAFTDAVTFLDWVSTDFEYTRLEYSSDPYQDWRTYVELMGYALPYDVWVEVQVILDNNKYPESEEDEQCE